MKTKEELNALKEEVEALNEKLAELTDEELVQVNGGTRRDRNVSSGACPDGFINRKEDPRGSGR